MSTAVCKFERFSSMHVLKSGSERLSITRQKKFLTKCRCGVVFWNYIEINFFLNGRIKLVCTQMTCQNQINVLTVCIIGKVICIWGIRFSANQIWFFFSGFFERLVILGDEQKDRSFWERDWHDQGREGGAHAQTYDLTLILADATSIKIQQTDVSFPYIETSLLSYQIFQSLFEVFSRLVISQESYLCWVLHQHCRGLETSCTATSLTNCSCAVAAYSTARWRPKLWHCTPGIWYGTVVHSRNSKGRDMNFCTVNAIGLP